MQETNVKEQILMSKFRRMAALLLVVMMVPFAAFGESAEGEHQIEKKTVPFSLVLNKGDEPRESEINLYFMDGGDIPYVAFSEYFSLYIDLQTQASNWKQDMTFTLRRNDEDGKSSFEVVRDDNNATMTVYTDPAMIYFDSYNWFHGLASSVSPLALLEAAGGSMDDIEKIKTGQLEGGFDPEAAKAHTFYVNEGSSFNLEGIGTGIDLDKYGIVPVIEGKECYLPLQTMNDLLLNLSYIQMVYFGDRVMAQGYMAGAIEEYTADTTPQAMSPDYALFNYNELTLLLDYFYGLKPEHDIVDFNEYLAGIRVLRDSLMSADAEDFDNGIALLTRRYLADLHSNLGCQSWRNPNRDGDAQDWRYDGSVGRTSRIRSQDEERFTAARNLYFKDGVVPGYMEIGDTAFITFDEFAGFNTAEDLYKAGIPTSLEECRDTVSLIIYANSQVLRENSPIRNVVMDLSCNHGGDLTAAVTAICWFNGISGICFRDTMTGAQSIMDYYVDMNLNEKVGPKYDADDSLAWHPEISLYCLISPLSFSCGNLVPAAFEDGHNVTIMGQTSGGGSCLVLPATSASGTLFQISGPTQVSIVKNGSFYNVDTGVDPDVELTKRESFYDREALVEMIHNLK